MSNSDRPSFPDLHKTPAQGYSRPGLIYIDDSAIALQTLRRALYPHGLIVETFESLSEFRERGAAPVIAVLLDVDLADGVSGLDVGRTLRAEHPGALFAFFTADASPGRTDRLAELGPVFSKNDGIATVVNWLLDAARVRSQGAHESR